jgi:hypothetical protein
MAIFANTSTISSYDGNSWKFSDGTGIGSGPFLATGTITGITCMAQYNGILLVANNAGQIAYFQDGTWFGPTTGGIANNATVLGAVQINSMIQFGKNLVVCGASGRVGSWNGATWTNYNAAGTGSTVLANNGTGLGVVDINTMCTNGTVLAFAGASGRVCSWNGTAWVNYNAAGTGVTVLANNGTVVTGGIIKSIIFDNKFVFTDGTRLGHWNGASWVNYNAAGTGVSVLANNGTCLSSFIGIVGDRLVCFSASGYGNYKTSTGLWSNVGSGSTWTRTATPYGSYATFYNGTILASGTDGSINQFIDQYQGQWYNTPVGGDNNIVALYQGINKIGQTYVFRYGNGEYFFIVQGNDINISYVINPTTNTIGVNPGVYAVRQSLLGKSRHLLSFNPNRSAGSFYSNATVGYKDFVNFGILIDPNSIIIPSTAIGATILGYGYNDLTIVNGANRSNYLFPSPFNSVEEGRVFVSNTNTLVNSYGKLTNLPGVTPPVPYEVRVGLINGVQSFLSLAVLDTSTVDSLGVIITTPGDFDPTYLPDYNDDLIVYRAGGVFYAVKIGTPASPFEQINDTLIQINTISPNNVYNDATGALNVSNCDYNGRMIFESSAVPASTSTRVASKFYTSISNGVDTGEKLVQITGLSSANITLPGVRLPLIAASTENYEVDTYIDGLYTFSTLGNLAELVDADKTDTLYLTDTTLPVPIGLDYIDGAGQYNNQTIFLDENRNTYTIGNDLQGRYDAFRLFGQLYLADEFDIYLAEVTNNVFSRLSQTASKRGLTFLAVSPNEAYFLSSFDNSLYTFTGGRSLNKVLRLTTEPAVKSGIWSEHENSLLLDMEDDIMFVRDSITSRTPKEVSIVGTPTYYNTTDGIKIVLANKSVQYTFEPRAGAIVVPLALQTAYYGPRENMLSKNTAYVITLYNFTKSAMDVTLTIRSFDQDTWYEQVETVSILPSDYNADGYVRCRIIPQNGLMLGSSIEVYCEARVVVTDITVSMESGAIASIVKST